MRDLSDTGMLFYLFSLFSSISTIVSSQMQSGFMTLDEIILRIKGIFLQVKNQNIGFILTATNLIARKIFSMYSIVKHLMITL